MWPSVTHTYQLTETTQRLLGEDVMLKPRQYPLVLGMPSPLPGDILHVHANGAVHRLRIVQRDIVHQSENRVAILFTLDSVDCASSHSKAAG